MMPSDQPDLFDPRPDQPERVPVVVSFPVARRRNLVREVALRLLRVKAGKRSAPWHRECAKLAAEMRAVGLESSSIDAELRRFFDVVDEEMHRLAGRASDSSGGSTAWRE